MPRKSRAAIEIENMYLPQRAEQSSAPPAPPDGTPEVLRKIIDGLIASKPAGFFDDDSMPLLTMYAQAIVASDEAFRHLQAEGRVVDGKLSPWVAVEEKAHRSAVAMAQKLRLAPQYADEEPRDPYAVNNRPWG
jgi:hypothetical protein